MWLNSSGYLGPCISQEHKHSWENEVITLEVPGLGLSDPGNCMGQIPPPAAGVTQQ